MVRPIKSGESIKNWINDVLLRSLVKRYKAGPGIKIEIRNGEMIISADFNQIAERVPNTGQPILGTFSAEHKNYIEINHNGGTVKVAKPPIIRQDDEAYAGVSLTSTDANTVTADDGSTEETWSVSTPYQTGNTIIAHPITQVIKDDAGSDLTVHYVEGGGSGRRWAKDDS